MNVDTPDTLGHVTTYQSGIVQSAAMRNVNKLTNDALKPYGITTMQWFIIGTISDYGNKGVRITDLGHLIDTKLSFLTNTVNLLESKHVLARLIHKTDQRSRLVVVSPEFRPKIKKIEEDLRISLRKSIYSDITPDELRIYVQVLYKLSRVS